MSKKFFLIGIILAGIFGGMIALFASKWLGNGYDSDYESFEQHQQAVFSKYDNDSSVTVPVGLNFVNAAELVRHAVVHIKTYYEAPTGRDKHLFDEEDAEGMEDFLERHQQQMPREGSGSGVIISRDGYIVTNNHVINEAARIEVVLENNRSFTAKLVGVDPTTDLALLKIDRTDLPLVRFGDSDKLKIGEWVLAVGNPFDLTSTVTAGIVSAKARNINILRNSGNMAIESFIQTDAAVNPGNSGGALVNLRGELVGINTAIASNTGSYTGYSFAVPVTLVKKVMEDLRKYGEVQRAMLGVVITDITAELAKEKGIEKFEGVYVQGVNDKGAAASAGLKEGDIIVKINGHKVNSSSELQESIARFRPGDKVQVSYVRNNKELNVSVMLRSKLGDTKIARREKLEVVYLSELGADVQPISRHEKEELDINNGIKVIRIKEDGKLAEAGVQEGFIITSIDKRRVAVPEDIKKILLRPRGGILLEGVYPDGKKAYYALGY